MPYSNNEPHLIAGKDSSGNLVPIKVGSDGSLGLSGGSGGDANAVNQQTTITELQSIKNNLANYLSNSSSVFSIWTFLSDIQSNIIGRFMPPGNFVSYLGTSTGALLKNLPGKICAFTCTHTNSETRYFQIINKNTNPVAGDIPLISFPVTPDNSLLIVGQDILGGGGIECGNGVSWGVSTDRLTYQPATALEFIVSVRWL